MTLQDGVKDFLRRFLSNYIVFAERDYEYSVQIFEGKNFKENLAENKVWNRGVPRELEEFYINTFDIDRTSFWGASSRSEDIRKIHINMPNIIVKILTDITINDLNNIKINNTEYAETWKEIERDNKFIKNLSYLVKNVLVYGDGVVKISFKPDRQKTPFISFVKAEDVEYVYEEGRLKETLFKKTFKVLNTKYYLVEAYGYGYIRYQLFNESMVEFPLNTVPELENLKDIIFLKEDGTIDTNINLAIPFKIWDSDLFEGRGKSVYEDKKQAFDALDEIWSQWIDAIRKGRTQRYIPKSLIPKDKNGNLLMKNDFCNSFIELDGGAGYNLEGSSDKVQVVEPAIQTDKYLESFAEAILLCLQGLMSPSTLGIDLKKLDNAEAQREKEKTTLYTRDNIIEALRGLIIEVIETSLRFDCYQKGVEYNDNYEISVIFGQYASPSFETMVSTMAIAAPGKQVISYEKIVPELYPELPEEEQLKEIERLHIQNGDTKDENGEWITNQTNNGGDNPSSTSERLVADSNKDEVMKKDEVRDAIER